MTDTAVLSGSLTTHNGNGGGNINLCLRRVTSTHGWGEVPSITPGKTTHTACHVTKKNQRAATGDPFTESDSSMLLCKLIKVCLQLEFGAGDIRGPLFGMKVFRNVTTRWQVLANCYHRHHNILKHDKILIFVRIFSAL